MAQASESASAMEVDNVPPAFAAKNDNKLQLPWVEKYRPQRYAFSCSVLFLSLVFFPYPIVYTFI
jgi:hypothetical protein